MLDLCIAASGACVGLVAFLGYVQLSPQIGNVWIRPNDGGERVFAPASAWAVLRLPLVDAYVWKPTFWDLNVLVWMAACAAVAVALVV
jgi:hypothetical protein